MNFGAYLESCIRKRNLSINSLSRECNINRGGLYSVFKQQRKLREDQLFNLIAKIGLTPVETDKLTDLFFQEFYGKEEFEKLTFLMKWMQAPLTMKAPSEDEDEAKVSVVQALQTFLAANSVVTTNFPFSLENVDRLFYNALQQGQISAVTHLVYLDEKDDYKHNYSAIFKSLKYMFLLQFPRYCWRAYNPAKVDTLLPFFAIGDQTAVLFSKSSAVTLKEKSAIQTLLVSAQKQLNHCKTLGQHPMDIMQIKDSYQKRLVRSGRMIEIQSYLCIAPFADRETMQNAVKPDIPNKEALVEIAYSHYQSLFSAMDYMEFTTENGLKEFARTGNIEEIPDLFVNPLDIPHRIRVLKKIVSAVADNHLYILDKNKITIPMGLSIEKAMNKVFFNGFDPSKESFFVSDLFFAELDDLSLVNALTDLTEYWIKSRKVCSKDYSVQFVNNIISGLECLV